MEAFGSLFLSDPIAADLLIPVALVMIFFPEALPFDSVDRRLEEIPKYFSPAQFSYSQLQLCFPHPSTSISIKWSVLSTYPSTDRCTQSKLLKAQHLETLLASSCRAPGPCLPCGLSMLTSTICADEFPAVRQSTSIRSIKSLVPLLDRVLVQRIKAEAKTASGIYLPESSVKELNEAKVLAVGPGGLDKEGKRIPMGVQTGDRVLIPTVRIPRREELLRSKTNGLWRLTMRVYSSAALPSRSARMTISFSGTASKFILSHRFCERDGSADICVQYSGQDQ